MISIADGKVVIDVILDDGTVAKGVTDLDKQLGGLQGSGQKAALGIGKIVAALGLVGLASKAIDMVTGSLEGAISRYDTLNNFPRVLEMMGFDAQTSEKAINRLSDGIDGLPTTLDSVASTTQRIAGMSGDLDSAVETTLALNNAFLASGSSSADAQRGLDQYVQMLSKGEVDLQSWRSLQETMPIALNKTAEAFGMTGASAQNDLYDALKEGDITFDQFNGKLIELSNATGGFAEMALTSSTGIATSWQNMKTAIVKGVADVITAIDEVLGGTGSIAGIIDQMKAAFQQAFAWIVGAIPGVVSGFMAFYNTIKPFLPLITGLVAAFLTFNTIISVIANVKIAIAGLRVTMAALNATMLANPVVLVIAVLAGLAAMLIYLWNTSDVFRNALISAFTAIQAVIMPAVQTIVDFVMGLWGMLVAWWQENSTMLLTSAQTIWNNIMLVVNTVVTAIVTFVMAIWATLTAFWQEHGQMILMAAQNVWMVIQTVISTVVTVIWTIIQTMATIVKGIMQFLWPFIQALVISTWNAIQGVIEGAIAVITGIIQFFSALFTGNWSAMWDAVKQIVSGAVQFVWNFIQVSFVGKIIKAGTTLAKALSGSMKSMWETIRLAFMYAVDFIKSLVSKGFNAMKSTVTTVMGAIRSVISTIWNAIRSVVSSVVNAVRSVVTSAFNAIRSVISSIMNSVRSTITSVWNGIKSTITTVVNNIKSTISNIFNSLKGIVTGAFSKVTGAVKTGIGNAYTAVTDKISDFFNAGKNIVGSIADGIKGAVGKVTGAMSDVVSKVRDFLPFSPAKTGPLTDIHRLDFGIIGEGIDRATPKVRGAIGDLTKEIESGLNVESSIPVKNRLRGFPTPAVNMTHADLTGTAQAIKFKKSMEKQSSEKQPATFNVYVGSKKIATEIVDDITNLQDRKSNRRRRGPKGGGPS